MTLIPACALGQDTLGLSAAAGGQVLSGNFRSYNVTASANCWVVRGKSEWDVSPSFRYTFNGALREREVYSAESYERHFTRRLKFLAFAEQEHSWLRRTLFRCNAGAGVSLVLYEGRGVLLEASEAALPDLYLSLLTMRARDNFTVRPSTRVKLRYEHAPVRIETVNMVQPQALGWSLEGRLPVIPYGRNVNFRSTTTVDAVVYKGLSVGARLDFIYQSYPHYAASSVEPYDLTFTFYLKYQLIKHTKHTSK